jgi:aldehyde:ferredoxin oxidoreductase
MFSLGQIVEIDLSTGRIDRYEYASKLFHKYLAGRGFNVWYLSSHLADDAKPLEAENIILFSCGLLTGTAAPTSARLHINSLSPLTGLIGSSNIGGYIGARMRACGIQSLIVRGQAAHPVYIYAAPDMIEIRDATVFWGLDALATQDRLREETGHSRAGILTIGPAGERKAGIACILSGKDHAAGRTGLGAVMGAKHLKALLIDGGKMDSKRRITPAIRYAIDHYVGQIKASDEFKRMAELGGSGWVQNVDEKGIIGSYNFRRIGFDDIEKTDGKHLKQYRTRSRGCFHCPVQCKAELHFKSGPYKGFKGSRPEFEPMINFGARCGLADIQAIVMLDHLCRQFGLDAISAAAAIAFAMDLYDRGILTPIETGGLEVTWGNAAVMEALIRQMAEGKGLGVILADGVRRAARVIGKGSEVCAAHVKGLEVTAYHPGAIYGSALGYAVSSRGGDYSNVYPSLEQHWSREKSAAEIGVAEAVEFRGVKGKGLLLRRSVLVSIALDCLGLCRVPALTLIGNYDLKDEALLLSAVTGLSFKPADLFDAADRIACLERIFNNRRGAGVDDDTLPPMFSTTTQPQIASEDFERMRSEYYAAMGWDKNGQPAPAKLAELGL